MNRIARFFDAEYADYNEDLPALQAYAQRTGGPLLEDRMRHRASADPVRHAPTTP